MSESNRSSGVLSHINNRSGQDFWSFFFLLFLASSFFSAASTDEGKGADAEAEIVATESSSTTVSARTNSNNEMAWGLTEAERFWPFFPEGFSITEGTANSAGVEAYIGATDMTDINVDVNMYNSLFNASISLTPTLFTQDGKAVYKGEANLVTRNTPGFFLMDCSWGFPKTGDDSLFVPEMKCVLREAGVEWSPNEVGEEITGREDGGLSKAEMSQMYKSHVQRGFAQVIMGLLNSDLFRSVKAN